MIYRLRSGVLHCEICHAPVANAVRHTVTSHSQSSEGAIVNEFAPCAEGERAVESARRDLANAGDVWSPLSRVEKGMVALAIGVTLGAAVPLAWVDRLLGMFA